ncbi:MAG TPA: hypothetical protein VIT45_18500 [Allosphingosinicella sp.]
MLARLPVILFWIAFLGVLVFLGAVGFAVVSLDSRPGGNGADWEAKLLIAVLVLGGALLTGFLAKGLGLLIVRLLGR